MERLKNAIRRWGALLAGAVAAVLIFVFTPFFALASDAFPVPAGDPVAVLLGLVTNWKAMGVLGVLTALTLLSSLAINSWVPESWRWKRLSTLAIAMVYASLAAAMAPNGSALASVMGVLITGLLSKGGASEIYEALKGAGVIKKDAGPVLAAK